MTAAERIALRVPAHLKWVRGKVLAAARHEIERARAAQGARIAREVIPDDDLHTEEAHP